MSSRDADRVSMATEMAPVAATSLVAITINDRLDSAAVPAVSAHLDRVLALEPRHVVIELAGCPYLDAAAIGLLLDVHRRLWQADGLLTLRAPTPRLHHILRVARVDRVLNIVTDALADPRLSRMVRPA